MPPDMSDAIQEMFGTDPDAPERSRRPERAGARPETDASRQPAEKPVAYAPGSPEHARTLQEIACRIERFLEGQLQRLERVLENSREAAAFRHKVQASIEELEQERREWEQQREAQLHSLAEEAARLRQAWDRLEAEQRRLSATRESFSVKQAASVPAAAGDGAFHSSNNGPDRPAQPDPAVMDCETASPESLLLQFQQLKREMRKHAQRQQ